jgi:hypothetical protein
MALSSVVAFMTAGIGTDRHARAPAHLRVDGRVFRSEHGRFEWRGISAFRLVEMVARRREGEAIAFLDWASKQELTVVRVFVMARHLFSLTPAEGLAALPRLLELANARGLHVEVVAFADTAQIRTDLEVHLKAVAAIAARHPNAILEIANEPGHPTQDVRLHNPAFLKQLAALVPKPMPVALGSAEYSADYASGDFVTYHFPRKSGWGHVFELARGAALIEHWRKPLINDEPIGAAAKTVDGRRDSDPRHFRGAAALTRLTGMGATFHYEGGLQARIPSGRELECFVAWRAGLGMVDGLPEDGAFLEGSAVGAIGDVSGAGAAFARVFELEKEAWLLLLDTSPRVSVGWKQGWSETGRNTGDGVALLRARR